MTPLRQCMLEDMRVRNFSPHTQSTYILQVSLFARYFQKPPDQLGPEEIRSYQVYLTDEKKLAPGSILIAVAALRFLYRVTLHKDWSVEDIIPTPKKPQKLPIILSPQEVRHFLSCVASPKHRTILTTCYAAGLHISEAVRLKPTAIDSQRMVIRVEQGKGQKDRYVMLSPKLLEILRNWWRIEKPKPWLFPGDIPGRHITTDAVELACREAHQLSRISKPITPHSLRHAFSVHLLEQGTDVQRIQLLLGHRSLPGGVYINTSNPIEGGAVINEEDLKVIRSKTFTLFVHGIMTYRDVFNCQHWTTFCIRFINDPFGWASCETHHNDADNATCQNQDTGHTPKAH